MQKDILKSISLNHIQIHDSFWNKHTQLVKDVIIPYQWNTLNDQVAEAEPSYCLENFKIAAGRKQGSFKGAVFADTDAAKWLEAVAYSLATNKDEELERLADETINLIGEAQCDNGYINTYFTVKEPNLQWTNLTEGHELYTAGHLIEAAVAYYEATGKTKFLDIVCKFADLICEIFLEEGKPGYPGHQEIELALIRLYKVTQKERYLKLAKHFLDKRGVGDNYFLQEMKTQKYKRIFPEFRSYDPKYSQSHLPVRHQKTVEGHAVRAVYMYCAMADLAYEYQDKELFESCKTLWNNMVKKRMYITGGIGSSGLLERFTTDYDLPNDSNYSESCASIGLALFGKRMAAITKDASYMDVVERTLYNNILAGIAMDGKSFFYVNPLEVWPNNLIDRTSKEHVKAVRQKWFGVACCPPNIARTLASLGQYIYFEGQDEIYVNLYISSETEVIIKDTKVHINQTSSFPKKGQIDFCVKSEHPVLATLAFRIPEYALDYKVYMNGKEVSNYEVVKGYLKITKTISDEHIEITFDTPAKWVRANPSVRSDSGKAAIQKGPFVYCLEEVDNGDNLASIYIDTKIPLIEEWKEDLLGGITVVKALGKKINQGDWKSDELYAEHPLSFQEVSVTAVPYCYWGNRITGEMLVWLKEFI